MNKLNDIAVIMSVYFKDKPEDLSIAVNSILSQTLDCDLYIYADGLLTSSLNEVLESFSNLNNVVIIRSDDNKGLAAALNTLIDIVSELKYKFVARMDSDDISVSDRIEKQVNFMNLNPNVDVLGGACKEFGASFALPYKCLPLSHNELRSFSLSRCPFIHPSVMFKGSLFCEGYRYPTDTSFTEDMGLWLLLLENGKTFANLPDILLHYRMNENTVERRKGLSKSFSEVKLRYKHMEKMGLVSVKNIVTLCARFFFHLLPVFFVKALYKFAR
ncbi:glycosyltransferase [Vibrio alginolyticus]|uniref:glycosyltransferase n=1 Tax=Vibrio alginolyticus TaxID=663 RepID=UPI001D2C18A7|nr:glycosyltransferase [Vibrio alginolyticus]